MNKVEELISYLNNTYGMEKKWPDQFEVSAELYGRVCHMLIKKAREDRDLYFNWEGFRNTVAIDIGPNDGVMFKNVELIIK